MIIFVIFLTYFLSLRFRYSLLVVGIACLLLFILLILKFHSKKLVLITVVTFSLGVGISYIDFSSKPQNSYPNQYDGIVYEVKDNYFLLKSLGGKFYCYYKNHSYEIGDILSITGEVKENDFFTAESSFDFNQYLANRGVRYTLNIKKVDAKFSNPIRLKAFKNYFLDKFSSETRGSVSSILFSDHEDNDLTNFMSNMHLTRLISAGGLYFNAIIGILIYLLSFKMKNKWTRAISFGLLFFYLVISFPRFSLLRLSIIFIFKWVNEHILKKRFEYLEILSLTGLFFLLVNKYLAYQDSFVLGFFIPIFLYFLNNSFSFLKSYQKKLLSIVALYLFFIPFEIKFFNAISPLLMIYQFILIPLFIFFFIMSILSLYGLPIYKALNSYNKILTYIINPFNRISFEIYAPPFQDWGYLIYYLFLFALLYYASIRFRPIKNYLISIGMIGLLIYMFPINRLISNEVTFVNVGQGDCCFIRNKNRTIFIDTGGLKNMDLAKDSLIPFLKKRQVYHLDLVVTTHNDFDHNGALSSLKTNFKINRIMDNTNFKNIKIGNVAFTNYNNSIGSGNDDNENSLVIGFTLSNTNYLITGDAGVSIEKQIMNTYTHIPCDILKVGHHGSKTSTSDAFIKYLKPKTGVISCGKNNSYGHPHYEVLKILKNNNVEIRRTDLEGSITYYSLSLL